MKLSRFLLIAASVAVATACTPGPHNVDPDTKEKAPDMYWALFPTSITEVPIVIEVNRTWAPIGADRFWNLMKDNYYDCATMFRHVDNFVSQWGISAEPGQTYKWSKPIADEKNDRTNGIARVSFATNGPNTRNTQIFVNLKDNFELDDLGFTPFGEVIMGFNENLVNLDQDNPKIKHLHQFSQEEYKEKGHNYIAENFQEDMRLIWDTAQLLTLDAIDKFKEEL